MGNKGNRINELVEIIKNKNGATIHELATLMQVSEMTIRRDLKLLSEQGIVKNLHGSTIYNPDNKIDQTDAPYHIENANVDQPLEKSKIGEFAATLIEKGDTIIVDTGTTTEVLVKNIDSQLPLQILCYNANILKAGLKKPLISFIFAGGYYHANTQMFESAEGVELIKKTRANKVFVSAAGIHHGLGVTCANGYEVDTKKAILKSGAEKILLADSKKFSVLKSSYFAEITEFDSIITDSDLSLEWQDRIQQLGIKLYLV